MWEEIRESLEQGNLDTTKRLVEDAEKNINRLDDVFYVLKASFCEMSGNTEGMFDAITEGLSINYANFELYFMLGFYYLPINANKAFLCFENAKHYAKETEDIVEIDETINELLETGSVSVNKVAVVIAAFNCSYMQQKNIESIRETLPEDSYSIYVVDNASTDGITQWLSEQKDVHLLKNQENKGFSVACNQAVSMTVGSDDEKCDIYLLNNDTRLAPNSLFWLRMGLYENTEVGATGSYANYAGNDQQIDLIFDTPQDYVEYGKIINVPMKNPYEERTRLSGLSMLIKREAWNRVSGMDEIFSPGYFEDDDICMKLAICGYRLLLCKNSFIYHAGSQSFSKRNDINELLISHQHLFIDKYGFDSISYSMPALELISQIPFGPNDSFNVLQLGSGIGADMKYIRSVFPNSSVVGVEKNPPLYRVSSGTDVVFESVDKLSRELNSEVFDVLIINKKIAFEYSREEVEAAYSLCKSGGVLITSPENKAEVDFSSIKLVIWDLDDTFWKGTISEGKIQESYSNIQLIRDLTDCGIICSVSSKNDEETAIDMLKKLDIADLFVFNNINWNDKGKQITNKLRDMGLRSENTLFIDDNPRNLQEAKFENPKLMVAGPEIISELAKYINHLPKTDKGHIRLNQYKLLQKKRKDSSLCSSGKEFLYESDINIKISYNCNEQISRIVELVGRTNQLNYTKNRSSEEELKELINNERYESAYINAIDKYGDYGIVGFYCLDKVDNRLIHFLFSCRIMGMGIDGYIYQKLKSPAIDIIEPVSSAICTDETYEYIHENSNWEEKKQQYIMDGEKGADKRRSILLKGPCDMDSIAGYLSGANLTCEFNYVNSQGFITTGQNHSMHIIESVNYSDEQIGEILKSVPFLVRGDFETTIFTKEYNVICYSLLPDCHAGLYRNKKTGAYISFGSRNFDLTDSVNKSGYINGTIVNHAFRFTEDIIDEFSKEWEFVGVTPVEKLISNLDYIYRNVKGNPQIILLMGSEIEYEGNNPEFSNHAEHHGIVNRAVRDFAKDRDRISLINFTDFIKSQMDYDDSINHFSRNVYYDLATEIVSCINGKSTNNTINRATIEQPKIAFCMLTFNHPQTIEHVLGRISDDFKNCGIDILVYDSSDNEETKSVVNLYVERGADNLRYIECKEINTGDEKLLYVLGDDRLYDEYDFIWPCKDRTIIFGKNLKDIVDSCKANPDAVIFAADMNRSGYIYPESKDCYVDVVELFRDYGALATSWESVLFNRKALMTIEWDKYYSDYGIGKDNNFNQPIVLFSMLSEINNPMVKVVHANPAERLYSSCSSSMWTNEMMRIFGETWPKAISRLPEIYDSEKAFVIKSETMLPELFGSMDNILYMIENKILTKDCFDKLVDTWSNLSDIPSEYIRLALDDNFEALVPKIITDYKAGFAEENYLYSAWIHKTNSWLKSVFGEGVYQELTDLFDRYISEINRYGHSELLDGVYSIEDAIGR